MITSLSYYKKGLNPLQLEFFSSYLRRYTGYKKGDVKKFGEPPDYTVFGLIEMIHNKRCHYCDRKVILGLDRKDNKRPHVKDNVLPCCRICNCIRMHHFTVEQSEEIIAVAKKYYLPQPEYESFGFPAFKEIEFPKKVIPVFIEQR
jgi:hypothetical protein